MQVNNHSEINYLTRLLTLNTNLKSVSLIFKEIALLLRVMLQVTRYGRLQCVLMRSIFGKKSFDHLLHSFTKPHRYCGFDTRSYLEFLIVVDLQRIFYPIYWLLKEDRTIGQTVCYNMRCSQAQTVKPWLRKTQNTKRTPLLHIL